MTDYIEWDGTEDRLYELLIWWGKVQPFEHSDSCEDPNQMHCCQGKTPLPGYQYYYGLQATTHGGRAQGDIPISFIDNVKNVVTPMDIGDRIYYRGGFIFELVKK